MRLNPPDVYDSHIVPIVRSYSAIKDIIASLEFARPDYDDRLVIAHIETFNMSPMEFLSSSWMIIVGFVNLRPATRTRMMRRKL